MRVRRRFGKEAGAAWAGERYGKNTVNLVVIRLRVFDTRLTVRNYRLCSQKLSAPVRLVLLTDLHSCHYGEGQGDLLDAVAQQHPDLILLGGDWVDDETERLAPERAYTAARFLSGGWPTYYVTGNHEFWNGDVERVREKMAGCGATLLAGTGVRVSVKGQEIWVCGIDDPSVGKEVWQKQLSGAAASGQGLLRILLTHRPERVECYEPCGFDLILAGHAHGGQWRIPGLLNGLYAPGQGLFPKYAGGYYALEQGSMIVSRGLARENTWVPRIFNPPELPVVDLVPAGEQALLRRTDHHGRAADWTGL